MIVIPVNADTSISTITGSYKPSKYVSKQNIQKIINKLSEDPAFNELSRMLLETAKSHIEVSELKDFASDIDTILKESNDRNTIKIGEEAKTIISTAAHLINNIEYAESGLITAMKNGYWVLFDGVESCPSNILERIITLLDFEPSLNLYEVDEGITYSTKSQNLIHDDFRIIITYNDVGTHKKTPLPQTILSRCAILRMDPIDIDPRTVAEISLFNVPDVDYILADQNVIDKIELVTRIGNCHCYIRNQQLEENPNGSSYEITGRSILRICKLLNYFCNISRNGEVDYNQIKRALTITYNKNFNEIDNDENQLNQSIYSSFLQDPDKDFITNLTQLYYKQVIDRNKLNGLIEERVRSDQPIINVFYVIERALFEDIFNLVDFLNELVKDFKSVTKQNWLIDYVYLQRLTDIVERLTELKDETKDDIKSLTLTNSLRSKDPKLKEILAEFSFLCQTYPTYEGITLPAQFASERFVLDSISNEIKINVFRYPNLYFNFPKIKKFLNSLMEYSNTYSKLT
ncbi:nuclear chaperone required for maturation and nuclear export of pre-60s ribosome subunits [Trichomonas vaginalis G3]|uniref:nuclear chaperone required for maturation and nuclear export of pre-60s ribosome subunits n=1 Tax=Trichomonas vaginalis (strain ATCC PRA-98 / G3) TaxID=412133 RepID=UPI0021E5F46E|nr:nuclear chaperone required for maturation and nuclear export of pre-60s ribosome subunits [Trichomonas vaginalis G3]KAI5534876.1 nuclear chaperone required for maturation and nuclear export of pre-60s ribosome subunits [Trichomonas vaginalis G3]